MMAVRTLVALTGLILFPFSFVSAQEEQDTVMYMQSVTVPTIFTHCITIYPELEMTFELAFERWQDENKRAVKRGKKALECRAKDEGIDLKVMLSSESGQLANELASSSLDDQKRVCSTTLTVLIEES